MYVSNKYLPLFTIYSVSIYYLLLHKMHYKHKFVFIVVSVNYFNLYRKKSFTFDKNCYKIKINKETIILEHVISYFNTV